MSSTIVRVKTMYNFKPLKKIKNQHFLGRIPDLQQNNKSF